MTTTSDLNLSTEEDPWADVEVAVPGDGFEFNPGDDKQDVDRADADERREAQQIWHRQQVNKQARYELIRIEARDLAQQEHARRKAEQRRALAGATEPLDWSTFLTANLRDIDWMVGKLMAAGQQMALVGDGKVGKSLFSLEWAWRMAAGMTFIGDVARRPLRVLYVDQENGHDDIQSRLISLGATPETLTNLTYLSFPRFAPLNTPEGGADLLAAVEAHDSEFVFLDTISRMVEGEENGNDTWLDLYRYTVLPLKARRIGSCRLDHFGKDDSKGARGGSAKNHDVDQVWELKAADKMLKLVRTYTRNGLGRSYLSIERQGERIGEDKWAPGKTRHVVPSDANGSPVWIGAAVIAERLDALHIPVDWSREKVRSHLRETGTELKASNDLLSEAINYRRSGERLVEG